MQVKTDIIGETQRFAEMQGNCGRKVSRWIDQLFPNGEFRYSLEEIFRDLNSSTLYTTYREIVASDIHRPVLVHSIQHWINSQMMHLEYTSMFTVEVENEKDTWDIFLVVKLAVIPENVKAKQSMLEALADVLSTAEDVIRFSNKEYLDPIIDEHKGQPMTLEQFSEADFRVQMKERDNKIGKYLENMKL